MPIDADAFRLALAESKRALGEAGGTRTSGHVLPIHRFLARELVRLGLPEEWMAPDPGRDDGRYWTQGVRRVMGQLSTKRLITRDPELSALVTRVGDEARRSKRQPFGAYHAKEVDVSAALDETGPLVVVSVKAPVSSVAKNAVNRYEEAIGDATNLHTRFPMLVFGFLMVLPKDEELYTPDVGPTSALRKLESLLAATSNRRNITDPPGSYEAACVAVVDYRSDPPSLLSDFPSADSGLRIEGFLDRIIQVFEERNRALLRPQGK